MNIRLRPDLERVRLGDFALPLGIDPVDRRPPEVGYTVSYNPGEEDDPDTYTFHIVVSHERLKALLARVFTLLPTTVWPIIEVDSYDAYRTIDVYIAQEDGPVSRDAFIADWCDYEDVLLEEGALGAGANSEEPFIEVFVDQWKAVSVHVPLDMRGAVEAMLRDDGLSEVAQTWPEADAERSYDATIRPVLDGESEGGMSLDDVIVDLRHRWNLELNVDPDRNLDEGGRELGVTLWHAGIVVYDSDEARGRVGYMSLWASARSLTELEGLIEEAIARYPEWSSAYECYSVTRVAFDDRPATLNHIGPRQSQAVIHLVDIQPVEEHKRPA